mgnify:CR=1 FL=1
MTTQHGLGALWIVTRARAISTLAEDDLVEFVLGPVAELVER